MESYVEQAGEDCGVETLTKFVFNGKACRHHLQIARISFRHVKQALVTPERYSNDMILQENNTSTLISQSLLSTKHKFTKTCVDARKWNATYGNL